jgi:hypothetical protein
LRKPSQPTASEGEAVAVEVVVKVMVKVVFMKVNVQLMNSAEHH